MFEFHIFTIYLRTADLDLGLDLISEMEDFLFLNFPNLNWALLLHVQIANLGSHIHPVTSLSINFLTVFTIQPI